MLLSVVFLELDQKTGYTTIKSDDYQVIFDDNNRMFITIEYQRSISMIDTEVFGSKFVNYTYVSDFSYFTQVLGSTFIQSYFTYFTQLQTSMVSLRLGISRTDIIDKIVFEKFGSPLAQFMSILNALMITGIIASMLSESKVFESIVQVQLRTFYRQTAAQLLKR